MAIQLTTGKRVAIKRMTGIFNDQHDSKRILREIVILKQLKHSGIAKLVDIIMPKDLSTFETIYIVLEYCESDLKKLLKSSLTLEWVHVQTILWNILQATKYLHESKVLHRDLKPANILLNEDCTVQICDFGLARTIAGISDLTYKILERAPNDQNKVNADTQVNMVDETPRFKNLNSEMTINFESQKDKQDLAKRLIKTKSERIKIDRQLTGHIATRWYRAPEIILLEKDYGPAIDLWSIGCITGELFSMIKENAPTFLDRKPLFTGNQCFPLSPGQVAEKNQDGLPIDPND